MRPVYKITSILDELDKLIGTIRSEGKMDELLYIELDEDEYYELRFHITELIHYPCGKFDWTRDGFKYNNITIKMAQP